MVLVQSGYGVGTEWVYSGYSVSTHIITIIQY